LYTQLATAEGVSAEGAVTTNDDASLSSEAQEQTAGEEGDLNAEEGTEDDDQLATAGASGEGTRTAVSLLGLAFALLLIGYGIFRWRKA
jgi:hypothetical protein